MHPSTIILPILGSIGRRARIVPRGVSWSIPSRASISCSRTRASVTLSGGGGSRARPRNSSTSPSWRSFIERTTSWRGVRCISGVTLGDILHGYVYKEGIHNETTPLHLPLESCHAAEVEAVPRAYPPGSTTPLL